MNNQLDYLLSLLSPLDFLRGKGSFSLFCDRLAFCDQNDDNYDLVVTETKSKRKTQLRRAVTRDLVVVHTNTTACARFPRYHLQQLLLDAPEMRRPAIVGIEMYKRSVTDVFARIICSQR